MSKFKKEELSEEDIAKAKAEAEKSGEPSDDEADDEDEDDTEGKDDKKEEDAKPSLKERCQAKSKEYAIKKENLSELKQIIPEGVSDEFVESFDTIVIGLVNEQISNLSGELIESLLEELDLEVADIKEAHKEFITSFVGVELDKFKESQQEAIVSTIKLEKAELFLTSLKALFVESNFILDDEKLEKVVTAEAKVLQLESEMNTHYTQIAKLKDTISEKEILIEMAKLTQGMTDLNKSRLVTMLESKDKKDSANYIKEAQQLKDLILKDKSTEKKTTPADDVDLVTENVDVDESDFNELLNNMINKKG